MAMGDLYELTILQRDRGQTVTNVFHYHQAMEFVTTYAQKAQVLSENFVTQKIPAIRLMQGADVTTTGIKVRNLFNESDAYEQSLSLPGTAGATTLQLLPTFNAISIALNGDNPAVKSGRKRFAGIPEDFQDDGVIVSAGAIAGLANLENNLESAVTVGTVIQDPVFQPVVIQRVRTGTPGNYQYRLPSASGEAIFSKVVVAAFNAIITSQISRKIGKGI